MTGGDLGIDRSGQEGRIAVLSAIEQGRATDAPLLAVVLIAGHPDIPLPYLSRITRVRDLVPTGGERDLAAWCSEEFQRTHDAYTLERPAAASPLTDAVQLAERLHNASRAFPLNRQRLQTLLNEALEVSERMQPGPIEPLRVAIHVATTLLHPPVVADQATPLQQVQPPGRLRLLREPTDEETDLGHLAREALIEAAREKAPLTWAQLCIRMRRPDLVRIPRETIFQILRAADREPDGRRRPLLSALLVESKLPDDGDNFIRIARDHHRRVPDHPTARVSLRKKEIAAVYAHWPGTPLPAADTSVSAVDPPTSARLTLPAEHGVLAKRYGPQVRDELIRRARSGRTMGWSELCAEIDDPALLHLQPEALAAVLAAADETTSPTEPMLSALLAVGDPQRCRKPFNMAAAWLGRPKGTSNARSDVWRVYEVWRHT